MKFGLVGTGPQGRRYLMPSNGGSSIVTTDSRRLDKLDLRSLDAVIIATHPAAHAELALAAIEARKPLIVEKPLALTLEDCERIIDAAARAFVPLEVAHTHLWSPLWLPRIPSTNLRVSAYYQTHERDYSPWLDWGPHVLSLAAQCLPLATPTELRAACHVGQHAEMRGVYASGQGWNYVGSKTADGEPTPMRRMLFSFAMRITSSAKHWRERNEFHRRVYRALFQEA